MNFQQMKWFAPISMICDINSSQSAQSTPLISRTGKQIGTQTNLEIALETAQMGTWYLDVQRDVSPVRSLRHDRIFGYDTLQPEWGQEIARRHVVAADREIFDAAFERSMTTGELNFEVRVRWLDGSIHWMAARGKFDFDRDYVTTIDTTENFETNLQRISHEFLTIFS
jgi:hypothetical protein